MALFSDADSSDVHLKLVMLAGQLCMAILSLWGTPAYSDATALQVVERY